MSSTLSAYASEVVVAVSVDLGEPARAIRPVGELVAGSASIASRIAAYVAARAELSADGFAVAVIGSEPKQASATDAPPVRMRSWRRVSEPGTPRSVLLRATNRIRVRP